MGTISVGFPTQVSHLIFLECIVSWEEFKLWGLKGLFTISLYQNFEFRSRLCLGFLSIEKQVSLCKLTHSLLDFGSLWKLLFLWFHYSFNKLLPSFCFFKNLLSLCCPRLEPSLYQCWLLFSYRFCFLNNSLHEILLKCLLELLRQFLDLDILLKPLIKLKAIISLECFSDLKHEFSFFSIEHLAAKLGGLFFHLL